MTKPGRESPESVSRRHKDASETLGVDFRAALKRKDGGPAGSQGQGHFK